MESDCNVWDGLEEESPIEDESSPALYATVDEALNVTWQERP